MKIPFTKTTLSSRKVLTSISVYGGLVLLLSAIPAITALDITIRGSAWLVLLALTFATIITGEFVMGFLNGLLSISKSSVFTRITAAAFGGSELALALFITAAIEPEKVSYTSAPTVVLLLFIASLAYELDRYLLSGIDASKAKKEAMELDAIKNLPIISAATIFWTEALCRNFDPPLTPSQIDAFSESLKTTIAREFLPLSVVSDFGMSLSVPHGFVKRLGADDIFNPAQDALAEQLSHLIRLDFYLPLVQMRIYEGQIKIRPANTMGRFDEWQVIYDANTTIEQVADIGRSHRPVTRWSHEQLAGANK